MKKITPLILTYNEENNLARVLDELVCASTVLIIDSFSDDKTIEIANKYSNTKILQRKFDNHTNQWNFGLDNIETEWVLSLDADYVVVDDLKKEIELLDLNKPINGYFIPFKYCVFGKPLRGTILPPRLSLYKKESARYIQDGHTQLLELKGQYGRLKNHIYHDDRKPLSRWILAQDKYMILEVEKFKQREEKLSFVDKIRKKIIIAPFLVIIYCLIVKRGVLDGWRGWFYALQRSFAEMLLSIRLIEEKFKI